MKTIQVAAAVIQDGNRVFATRRGYKEFKDGWEFPSGKNMEKKQISMIQQQMVILLVFCFWNGQVLEL